MTALQLTAMLLHFGAAAAYVALAIYILRKDSAALLNRLCALTAASFAIWALAETFMFVGSPRTALLSVNIAAIGWCSFPVIALWFYLVLTGHERIVRNPIVLVAGVGLIAFFLFQQWTGHLINEFVPRSYGWGQVWAPGLMPIVFYVYYFVPALACVWLTVRYGRSSQSVRTKKQARLLSIAPPVCLVLGSITDVAAPVFGLENVPPLAVVFILIWALALVRAITRYGLMSLTPATAAESILSTMSDLVLLVDTAGDVARANQAAYAMLGYSEEELQGKQLASLMSPSTESASLPSLQGLDEGLLHNRELTMRTKTGDDIPVLLSASQLKNEEGEVAGAVVVAHDIADYQAVQQALRHSEEKYRTLVDHALVGIGIHQDNKLIFANAELAAMLGYTIDEGIGLPIAEIIHPDEREVVMRRARRRQAGAVEPERYELRLLKKDGTAIYAFISNAVIEYQGRPATLITIANISDSKMRVELEQANKELESFSYSVSHDLRAPLRSIDGFSQALLEDYGDSLDEQAKNYLDRVRAASQHMAALIDDLLRLSRVTRAQMHYEQVDMSAMAQSVANELKEMEPERNVELVIAEGLVAYGDATLLRTVLQNLLINAWKFTARHPKARIEFGAAEQDGQAVYFVRDDGAGFDMAYAGKLFTPFQRLHSAAEFKGTGIGLATVQRIIHRHGGTVWAEGEVEKGATFYFTLE